MDWYHHEAFKCSNYYHLLGNELVNFGNHLYVPFHEVDKSYNMISRFFPESVFIRSNVGTKTMPAMTHKTFTRGIFKDSWDGLTQIYTGNPDSLVLLCEDKTDSIMQEWRFFVVGGIVVTGSRYMDHGRVVLRKLKLDVEFGDGDNDVADCDLDRTAMLYAQSMATIYLQDFPVSSYTIDVCRMASGVQFRVVELNALNCSGIYSCDPDVFVKAVTDRVIKEYEEDII
jgi:hypothetical protein